MSEVMVSVSCLVYNHEKYLRQCLDGFVMQRTNFPFEVIVHDDASTDHSADIIQEYAEKYPDIIKPIYQEENQYSQHIPIMKTFIYPKMQGKYIAFCEGDDFWIDPLKLQKQFDAMEANPECSMCAGKNRVCADNGTMLDEIAPPKRLNLEGGRIKKDKLAELLFLEQMGGYPFHTSVYFLRRSVCEYRDTHAYSAYVDGDIALLYATLATGDVYYIDEIMSVYRKLSIGSHTYRAKTWSGEQRDEHKLRFIKANMVFDQEMGCIYHAMIMPLNGRIVGKIERRNSIREAMQIMEMPFLELLRCQENLWRRGRTILLMFFPHLFKLQRKLRGIPNN